MIEVMTTSATCFNDSQYESGTNAYRPWETEHRINE